MQSSLLRFITMVALLINVICEDAKEEKGEIRETRDERQNAENYEDLSNDKLVDIDEILSDSAGSKTNKLAQKFANDALKSLKMQETINKLADIGASRNDLHKVSQLPVREHAIRKSKMKSNRSKAIRHKDRMKRKRKRHKHRHHRRPRWSKKGSAKTDYDSNNKQSIVKKKTISVRRSSIKPEHKIKTMLRKNGPSDNKSMSGNITVIHWDNLDVEDYIDLTQSTRFKPDTSTISMKADETESMVERLMKTTTKDPKKKNPGDQGVEYADYYNDIDAVDEGRHLKEKRKNPRARSIRQSYTMSSNQNYKPNIYVSNEDTENDPNLRYLDENANNFLNHIPNFVSPESVQRNDADDKDSLNLQIGKERNGSPKELVLKKSYDSRILPMGQDQNSGPVKSDENFVKGVSNSAFSQLGQNERSQPLLVGQENSVNTDVNPTILQSNENQYSLPVENDDKNVYNNYVFNSGQEEKVQHPVEDNLNYLNNYGTLLQKNDEKYIYPIANNLPQDPINVQLQLPEVNKNWLVNPNNENMINVDHQPLYELSKYSDKMRTPEINKNEENPIELKNPTNIYSELPEKTFVLPQDQQPLRYVPGYKNTDQGNRLLLINPTKPHSEAHDKTITTLREKISINKNTNEPLRKISDVSPSDKYVQPVERFLSSPNLEYEDKTWEKENESNNPVTLNQQMIRRGLRKGVGNSGSSEKLEESPAEEEERLRREFAKRRNRYSVEEDVLNAQRVNIGATVNETREVANQILNRIVDELEEIKMDHSKDKNSEGFPCKLTGSWVTSKAGVRIDMKVMNHSIIVALANLIPQPMHLGFLNTTWNVTGHAPFNRGGPFSLLAYDNRTKTLAVFVGSCRVCQGIDTIQGVWSVAHEPKDCRNFQMATEIFNDVFRRTKLLSAIKEKKKAMLQSMLMRNVTNATSYSDDIKNEKEQNDRR